MPGFRAHRQGRISARPSLLQGFLPIAGMCGSRMSSDIASAKQGRLPTTFAKGLARWIGSLIATSDAFFFGSRWDITASAS